jgi:hypothetical protein
MDCQLYCTPPFEHCLAREGCGSGCGGLPMGRQVSVRALLLRERDGGASAVRHQTGGNPRCEHPDARDPLRERRSAVVRPRAPLSPTLQRTLSSSSTFSISGMVRVQ